MRSYFRGADKYHTILIHEMLCVPVNIEYIRAKNRAAHNIKSHQLEQHSTTTLVGGTFHDTVFNIVEEAITSHISEKKKIDTVNKTDKSNKSNKTLDTPKSNKTDKVK